jgi:hypothetical protein
VLKLDPGDPIKISATQFELLSGAFLAEVDAKFVN